MKAACVILSISPTKCQLIYNNMNASSICLNLRHRKSPLLFLTADTFYDIFNALQLDGVLVTLVSVLQHVVVEWWSETSGVSSRLTLSLTVSWTCLMSCVSTLSHWELENATLSFALPTGLLDFGLRQVIS